jgi:hypothetical protein
MLDFDGTRWAIAIKTVSSQQGQTLYENVKKAAKQINASSADKGLILLNVKDSLNYKLLRKTHFNSVKDATDALKAELERLIVEIERDRPASDWDPIFAGNAKTPVLLMGQTMARVLVAGLGTIPVPIKMILAYSCGKDADKNGIELAESLNHFMQTILKGEPGPPAC